MLALWAAKGTPDCSMISLTISFDGILIPTLSSPAVVSVQTSFPFDIMIVSGPGQNSSISFLAFWGTYLTNPLSISILEICSINGLSCGRPLALNIFCIATGFLQSPASPYTV